MEMQAGDLGSILVRKVPWKRKWQPTLVFLPGKACGQGSLTGYSSWCYKESNTTEHILFLLLLLLPARQIWGLWEIDYWKNKLLLVLTDVSSTILQLPDQVTPFGSFWEQQNCEYQEWFKILALLWNSQATNHDFMYNSHSPLWRQCNIQVCFSSKA